MLEKWPVWEPRRFWPGNLGELPVAPWAEGVWDAFPRRSSTLACLCVCMLDGAPDRCHGLLGWSEEEEGSVLARPPGSDMLLVVRPFHHSRDWLAQFLASSTVDVLSGQDVTMF